MSTISHPTTRRRPSIKPSRKPPYPHVITLRDGRKIYIEIPADWITCDANGETLLLPPAVEMLDKIQALAQPIENIPTRGHIVALRQALGLTQKALGQAVGVDKLTVSRWERGEVKPSAASAKRLRKIQDAATKRGVTVGKE
jgi:DNA-binding transcriptional regulator YiaG